MRSFSSIPFFVTVLVASAARCFSLADHPSVAAIRYGQKRQLLRQRTTTGRSSIFTVHTEAIHQPRKLRKLDDNDDDDDDSWFRNAAGQILWWIWLLVVIAASVVLFCIVYCCCMATCCGLCYLKKQQDNEKAEFLAVESAQAVPATVAASVAASAPVAEPYVAEPYVAEPYVATATAVPPKQAEHSDDGFATGFQD